MLIDGVLHVPRGVWQACEHKHSVDDVLDNGKVADIWDIGLTCNWIYDVCERCCIEGGHNTIYCATNHGHEHDRKGGCPAMRSQK